MTLLLLTSILLFSSAQAEASPISPEPILIQEEIRHFPVLGDVATEQSINITGQGKSVIVTYSSNADIEMRISFPLDATGKGNAQYNPMMMLRFPDIPLGSQQEVILDLTASPAWSPSRQAYILHVRGQEGATVQIHNLEFIPASFSDRIRVAFRHLLLDETVQLSTSNYRFGYRVLDIPFSVIMGMMFFIASGVFLIGFIFSRRNKYILRSIMMLCITFLLLYDVRFSFNLLRTGYGDLSHWIKAGEYRQLGPIHHIVDILKSEREHQPDMVVDVCLDLDDLYFKQLRYYLAPTSVIRGDSDNSTHMVFIGKSHAVREDGTLSCGEEPGHQVELIKQFGEGNAVYRFTDSIISS